MKSLLESKTFWFNVIMVCMEFSAMGEFTAIVPQHWLPYVAALQALGNIVLRVYSTKAIVSVTP